jgi:glycine/D-amino acid oxidase-like deaminating enzyme
MPRIESVPSSTDFPKQASAVVIGAGVIGISTALELQARGLDVVVIEKGEVAAEQSSRNWGWCRQTGRDPREIPLIKVSLDLWRGMNHRIGAETGYRTCGIVYLNDDEQQQAQHEKWVQENASTNGLSTRILKSSEIASIVPGCAKPWAGGMYTADDGRAEPFVAVPAMARFFQSKGGRIFTQCAARGLESSAGKVSHVVTEKGSIKTDTVIIAGGYWSSRFLHNLDIGFPQLGVINSVLRTKPIETGNTTTFSGRKFAVRKRMDGGFTIAHNHLSVSELTSRHFRYFADFLPIMKLEWRGIRLKIGKHFVDEWNLPTRWSLDQMTPFEMVRVLDPAPHIKIQQESLQSLKENFPAFKNAEVAESWGGMIDATPDAVPVIDTIKKIPGLFMASGFSGHGFGLGPGAGRLMAEIVTGERTCVDATPFRFTRFVDGTRPMPTTGL